jgi:hypothetical protein
LRAHWMFLSVWRLPFASMGLLNHLARVQRYWFGVQFVYWREYTRAHGMNICSETGCPNASGCCEGSVVYAEDLHVISAPMWLVDRPEYERRVAEARAQVGSEAWEVAWAACKYSACTSRA